MGVLAWLVSPTATSLLLPHSGALLPATPSDSVMPTQPHSGRHGSQKFLKQTDTEFIQLVSVFEKNCCIFLTAFSISCFSVMDDNSASSRAHQPFQRSILNPVSVPRVHVHVRMCVCASLVSVCPSSAAEGQPATSVLTHGEDWMHNY